MKKLLVLGATPFQIPIVKKAHQKGLHVTTMDNLPDSPAHAYADESVMVSITDKEKVLDYARNHNIDGIITGGSDVGVPSIGYVCDQLGLSGVTLEQGLTMTRKDLFRDFQEREGLGGLEFYVFDSYEDFLETCAGFEGKFVAKPVDRSGSKGVAMVDFANFPSEGQLHHVFEAAQSQSLANRVIFERFLEGVEWGGDLFLNDGECICFSPTNKHLTFPPYYVPVGHTIPSILPELIQQRIRETLTGLLQRLGVNNGPVNFDVMANDAAEVTVLEMSPRFGGNCIPQIIEYGADFDEIGATIDYAIHGTIPDRRARGHEEVSPTGVRIIGCSKTGILNAITPRLELLQRYDSQILELVYDVTSGDQVHKFTQGNFRIGHVIATAPDIGQLDALLDEIEARINQQV